MLNLLQSILSFVAGLAHAACWILLRPNEPDLP